MSEEMQDSIADINEEQLETMKLEDVEVKDEEILDEAKSKKVEDADEDEDEAEVEVDDDESEVEDEDEEVKEDTDSPYQKCWKEKYMRRMKETQHPVGSTMEITIKAHAQQSCKSLKEGSEGSCKVISYEEFNKEVDALLAEQQSTVDFSDDLNALVEGEESLAEGFKDKAALIFEAAISSKLKVEVAKLEESYESKLEEATAEVKESLVDKVDSYLTYVAEQWVEENKLQVESGLRTEIAESFMSSLYDVFAEHHIDVPEEKVSLVDELAEQVEKLSGQLNESVDKGIELSKTIKEHQRVDAIATATVGMTELDIEKLKGLVESVEFDGVESFTSKIETIKESYFKVKAAKPEEELLVATDADKSMSSSMAAYVAAINNNTKF